MFDVMTVLALPAFCIPEIISIEDSFLKHTNQILVRPYFHFHSHFRIPKIPTFCPPEK